MSLNLYYYFLCPFSRSVKYFLNSNHIRHKEIHIDLVLGDHMSREYRSINPLQKVPAIKDSDFILFESTSILRYIANSRKLENQYYPSEPKERAQIDLFFDWQAANLSKMLKYMEVVKGFDTKIDVEKAKEYSDSILSEFEEIFLKKTKFIGNDSHMTIADLAIVWHLAGLIDIGYTPSQRITKYLSDIYEADSGLEIEIDDYLSDRRAALQYNILLPFTSFKTKTSVNN